MMNVAKFDHLSDKGKKRKSFHDNNASITSLFATQPPGKKSKVLYVVFCQAYLAILYNGTLIVAVVPAA